MSTGELADPFRWSSKPRNEIRAASIADLLDDETRAVFAEIMGSKTYGAAESAEPDPEPEPAPVVEPDPEPTPNLVEPEPDLSHPAIADDDDANTLDITSELNSDELDALFSAARAGIWEEVDLFMGRAQKRWADGIETKLEKSPKGAESAERLRVYWSIGGPGGAKIRWNTPNDWYRCVTLTAPYLGPRAKGYCQLLHKRNTGAYAGHSAGDAAGKADKPATAAARAAADSSLSRNADKNPEKALSRAEMAYKDMSMAERLSKPCLPGTTSYPIGDLSDLHNAIQAWGRCPVGHRAALKVHMSTQATRLGASKRVLARIARLGGVKTLDVWSGLPLADGTLEVKIGGVPSQDWKENLHPRDSLGRFGHGIVSNVISIGKFADGKGAKEGYKLLAGKNNPTYHQHILPGGYYIAHKHVDGDKPHNHLELTNYYNILKTDVASGAEPSTSKGVGNVDLPHFVNDGHGGGYVPDGSPGKPFGTTGYQGVPDLSGKPGPKPKLALGSEPDDAATAATDHAIAATAAGLSIMAPPEPPVASDSLLDKVKYADTQAAANGVDYYSYFADAPGHAIAGPVKPNVDDVSLSGVVIVSHPDGTHTTTTAQELNPLGKFPDVVPPDYQIGAEQAAKDNTDYYTYQSSLSGNMISGPFPPTVSNVDAEHPMVVVYHPDGTHQVTDVVALHDALAKPTAWTKPQPTTVIPMPTAPSPAVPKPPKVKPLVVPIAIKPSTAPAPPGASVSDAAKAASAPFPDAEPDAKNPGKGSVFAASTIAQHNHAYVTLYPSTAAGSFWKLKLGTADAPPPMTELPDFNDSLGTHYVVDPKGSLHTIESMIPSGEEQNEPGVEWPTDPKGIDKVKAVISLTESGGTKFVWYAGDTAGWVGTIGAPSNSPLGSKDTEYWLVEDGHVTDHTTVNAVMNGADAMASDAAAAAGVVNGEPPPPWLAESAPESAASTPAGLIALPHEEHPKESAGVAKFFEALKETAPGSGFLNSENAHQYVWKDSQTHQWQSTYGAPHAYPGGKGVEYWKIDAGEYTEHFGPTPVPYKPLPDIIAHFTNPKALDAFHDALANTSGQQFYVYPAQDATEKNEGKWYSSPSDGSAVDFGFVPDQEFFVVQNGAIVGHHTSGNLVNDIQMLGPETPAPAAAAVDGIPAVPKVALGKLATALSLSAQPRNVWQTTGGDWTLSSKVPSEYATGTPTTPYWSVSGGKIVSFTDADGKLHEATAAAKPAAKPAPVLDHDFLGYVGTPVTDTSTLPPQVLAAFHGTPIGPYISYDSQGWDAHGTPSEAFENPHHTAVYHVTSSAVVKYVPDVAPEVAAPKPAASAAASAEAAKPALDHTTIANEYARNGVAEAIAKQAAAPIYVTRDPSGLTWAASTGWGKPADGSTTGKDGYYIVTGGKLTGVHEGTSVPPLEPASQSSAIPEPPQAASGAMAVAKQATSMVGEATPKYVWKKLNGSWLSTWSNPKASNTIGAGMDPAEGMWTVKKGSVIGYEAPGSDAVASAALTKVPGDALAKVTQAITMNAAEPGTPLYVWKHPTGYVITGAPPQADQEGAEYWTVTNGALLSGIPTNAAATKKTVLTWPPEADHSIRVIASNSLTSGDGQTAYVYVPAGGSSYTYSWSKPYASNANQPYWMVKDGEVIAHRDADGKTTYGTGNLLPPPVLVNGKISWPKDALPRITQAQAATKKYAGDSYVFQDKYGSWNTSSSNPGVETVYWKVSNGEVVALHHADGTNTLPDGTITDPPATSNGSISWPLTAAELIAYVMKSTAGAGHGDRFVVHSYGSTWQSQSTPPEFGTAFYRVHQGVVTEQRQQDGSSILPDGSIKAAPTYVPAPAGPLPAPDYSQVGPDKVLVDIPASLDDIGASAALKKSAQKVTADKPIQFLWKDTADEKWHRTTTSPLSTDNDPYDPSSNKPDKSVGTIYSVVFNPDGDPKVFAHPSVNEADDPEAAVKTFGANGVAPGAVKKIALHEVTPLALPQVMKTTKKVDASDYYGESRWVSQDDKGIWRESEYNPVVRDGADYYKVDKSGVSIVGGGSFPAAGGSDVGTAPQFEKNGYHTTLFANANNMNSNLDAGDKTSLGSAAEMALSTGKPVAIMHTSDPSTGAISTTAVLQSDLPPIAGDHTTLYPVLTPGGTKFAVVNYARDSEQIGANATGLKGQVPDPVIVQPDEAGLHTDDDLGDLKGQVLRALNNAGGTGTVYAYTSYGTPSTTTTPSSINGGGRVLEVNRDTRMVREYHAPTTSTVDAMTLGATDTSNSISLATYVTAYARAKNLGQSQVITRDAKNVWTSQLGSTATIPDWDTAASYYTVSASGQLQKITTHAGTPVGLTDYPPEAANTIARAEGMTTASASTANQPHKPRYVWADSLGSWNATVIRPEDMASSGDLSSGATADTEYWTVVGGSVTEHHNGGVSAIPPAAMAVITPAMQSTLTDSDSYYVYKPDYLPPDSSWSGTWNDLHNEPSQPSDLAGDDATHEWYEVHDGVLVAHHVNGQDEPIGAQNTGTVEPAIPKKGSGDTLSYTTTYPDAASAVVAAGPKDPVVDYAAVKAAQEQAKTSGADVDTLNLIPSTPVSDIPPPDAEGAIAVAKTYDGTRNVWFDTVTGAWTDTVGDPVPGRYAPGSGYFVVTGMNTLPDGTITDGAITSHLDAGGVTPITVGTPHYLAHPDGSITLTSGHGHLAVPAISPKAHNFGVPLTHDFSATTIPSLISSNPAHALTIVNAITANPTAHLNIWADKGKVNVTTTPPDKSWDGEAWYVWDGPNKTLLTKTGESVPALSKPAHVPNKVGYTRTMVEGPAADAMRSSSPELEAAFALAKARSISAPIGLAAAADGTLTPIENVNAIAPGTDHYLLYRDGTVAHYAPKAATVLPGVEFPPDEVAQTAATQGTHDGVPLYAPPVVWAPGAGSVQPKLSHGTPTAWKTFTLDGQTVAVGTREVSSYNLQAGDTFLNASTDSNAKDSPFVVSRVGPAAQADSSGKSRVWGHYLDDPAQETALFVPRSDRATAIFTSEHAVPAPSITSTEGVESPADEVPDLILPAGIPVGVAPVDATDIKSASLVHQHSDGTLSDPIPGTKYTYVDTPMHSIASGDVVIPQIGSGSPAKVTTVTTSRGTSIHGQIIRPDGSLGPDVLLARRTSGDPGADDHVRKLVNRTDAPFQLFGISGSGSGSINPPPTIAQKTMYATQAANVVEASLPDSYVPYARSNHAKPSGDDERFKDYLAQEILKRMDPALDEQLLGGINPASYSPEELYQKRYDNVASMVGDWAVSSNDHNVRGLAIQEMAIPEFGLDPEKVYSWQLTDASQSSIAKIKEDIAKCKETQGDALKAFLRAQYDATQEMFAAAGVTHVQMARGVGCIHSTPSWYNERNTPVEVKLSALSSTSYRYSKAQDFANNSPQGRVMRADVPVEHIVSSARTGSGCKGEWEFVVLGGQGQLWKTAPGSVNMPGVAKGSGDQNWWEKDL